MNAPGIPKRKLQKNTANNTRSGEIARVASRLGEANININYAYCGLESGTNSPLVFFGVSEIGRAAQILEQPAAAAAKP